MSDSLEALVVEFSANIESLTSAETAIDSVFANVASAAESSGSEMSSSMTTAAESFGALQDAIASLVSSVNDATSEIDSQLASIATEAEESASQSETAFSGFDLGGMVNQIGMTIFSLQNMANVASQAASSLLGPAVQAENTEASFTNLMGSSQAAGQELDQLNQFASKTQFKTQDIDNMAASLIAFKTPTKQIIPDLQAVGDALTAVGKGTPAEMQGVVDLLGKMSIQGKLTEGDITMLGKHGINAMDAIALGSGKTTDQIQQMIKDGTFPANDAIDALTKGIEKNPIYAGGMAKQANTLSGQMSTLSSDFDQAMAAAMKPALPDLEKTLTKLTTVLTSPSFKQFAQTLGKDIAKGLDDVITGVTNLVKFGKNLTDFFSHNQTAMDALYAGLVGVGAIILAVVIPAMVAWAIAMAPVALEAIIVAAPFILLGVIVGAIVFGIIEAIQHWSQIMSFAGGVVTNVIGGVSSFFKTVGDDMQGVFHGIGDVATKVFDGLVNGFKAYVNFYIKGIDFLIDAVNGIHIDIPRIDIGPIHMGGGTLSLPHIPRIPLLARGGYVPPGEMAIAGETGQPELVYGGSSGASVLGVQQTAALMNGGGGETHVHNHIYLDGREMTNIIMEQVVRTVRAQGGRMVSV